MMLYDACHMTAWNDLRNDNQAALMQIYDQHYTGLMNYGLKLCNDRELAKDCITQILIRLWDHRRSLPEVSNVRSYLITCLRREIIQELRRSNKQHLLAEVNNEQASYEEQLIRTECDETRKHVLLEALKSLTDRERELIRMKFFEDLDYSDIAQKCNITRRTAYNIIHTALRRLREGISQPIKYELLANLVIAGISLLLFILFNGTVLI